MNNSVVYSYLTFNSKLEPVRPTMKFLLLIALALVASSQTREIGIRSFNGYQVLTVTAETLEQFSVLKELWLTGDVDFWTNPKSNGNTDIMVSPVQQEHLIQLLKENGMKYKIKISNVQKLVDEERVANRKAEGKMAWDRYPRYAEIEEWILTLSDNPSATVINIGQTYEKRNIYAVKISSGGAAKKSILIDANIHAREWIAGATATWILNELTTNTDAYSKILEEIDIYIIPLINIDGYEYAQTTDRLWRKTRSVNAGTTCRGCDPNRNWSFHFGGESTSSSPCSDLYTGPNAFSEPETAAVRDFVISSEASGVTFKAYLTFHAYAQQWLLPWGYTQGVYPPDYSEQLSLGQASIAALKAVNGIEYETGQGADLLYGVGGASDDWHKDHGVKYTTTIEMRDTGDYGFVLPPAQIIPNAKEIWAAVQVVFDRVISDN